MTASTGLGEPSLRGLWTLPMDRETSKWLRMVLVRYKWSLKTDSAGIGARLWSWTGLLWCLTVLLRFVRLPKMTALSCPRKSHDHIYVFFFGPYRSCQVRLVSAQPMKRKVEVNKLLCMLWRTGLSRTGGYIRASACAVESKRSPGQSRESSHYHLEALVGGS